MDIVETETLALSERYASETTTVDIKVRKTSPKRLKAMKIYYQELKSKNPDQYNKKLQMAKEREYKNRIKVKEALKRLEFLEQKINEIIVN